MNHFSPVFRRVCRFREFRRFSVIKNVGPKVRKFTLNRLLFNFERSLLKNYSARGYCSGSDIPELHGKQFFDYLRQKKHFFAFFYDPFCPHCRKAEPEFLKAARSSSIPFVKVDGTENESLCKQLKIDGFPTFRYFTATNSKISWSTFSGPKEERQFITFLESEASGGSSSKINGIRRYSSAANIEKSKLLHLTTSNISEQLREKNVLVLFYNASCNECDDIINTFIEATNTVDKNIGQFALCNSEQNSDIARRYAIDKFPTIKYFKNGRYLSDYHDEPKLDRIVLFMGKMKSKIYPSKLSHSEKVSLWNGIDGAENILHITNDNLVDTLKLYPSLLIFFYACWSRSCLDLKSVYSQAAKKLDKKYGTLAACDAEDNTEVADQLLVSHFPTFKYFRNGHYLTDYEGERSEENFLKFMKEPGKLGFVKVENRIKPSYSVLSLTGNIPPYWTDILGAESLIFVTDYNFKSILQYYKTILVMFYVPWCKACTKMKKEYGKAAFSLPLEWSAAIAACDAEENNYVADKFLVTKLPSLKIFKNGVFVEDYRGRRTQEEILKFIKEVSMRNLTVKQIAQSTRPFNFDVSKMLDFWNEVEGGTKVVLLNENNFHMFISQEGSLLILFYNAETEMETLRKEFALAAKNVPKEVAYLAAYEYKEDDSICKSYKISIQDLPVLKLFHGGKFKSDFTGLKSADSILKFLSSKDEVAKQISK